VADKMQVTVGRRRFDMSRPDKVLFPTSGTTKADLVSYYRRTASVMLSHLRGRPLMLQRCPDGIAGDCFYQKEASSHFPGWIKTVEARKEGGVVHHVVCDDEATLAYLAGQACISFHSWLSRADRIDRPDKIIFDFDPSADDFSTVRDAAQSAGRLLEEIGLKPFVATTGSRGLHVVTPIQRRGDFDEVRDFAFRVAGVLAAQDPDRLTTESRKNRRQGRVFIDVMRNAYAQTAIAPYSVRTLPGAPVATPLEWSELESEHLDAQRYTIENLHKRLESRGDPWADIARHARPLAGARQRLEALS
jgi:bifunctional non-homologous end joining protein LigD